MNDNAFRQLLGLLMALADPPTSIGVLKSWAEHEARERGYESMVDAYHRFKPGERSRNLSLMTIEEVNESYGLELKEVNDSSD